MVDVVSSVALLLVIASPIKNVPFTCFNITSVVDETAATTIPVAPVVLPVITTSSVSETLALIVTKEYILISNKYDFTKLNRIRRSVLKIKIKFPKKKKNSEVNNFFKKKKLFDLISKSKLKSLKVNQMKVDMPSR